MLLMLFLLAIMGAVFALLWNQGMWSSIIALVNTVFAAMMATNYFEPVARWLEGLAPTYTYLWDFLALWLLFALFFGLSRLATDFASRFRVRSLKFAELGGAILSPRWTGWTLVCFTCFTLHTAPLPRSPFGGAFQPTATASNALVSPGWRWLGFVHSRSRGALSAWGDGNGSPYAADRGTNVFDPRGEFILRYAQRRHHFEVEPNYRVPFQP